MKGSWNLLAGVDICEVIADVGNDIDFLFIDSSHRHPIETINFLCALPFLKNGALVIVHDTALFQYRDGFICGCFAPRYLICSVAADKIEPCNENIDVIPNIAAFVVSEDTKRYVKNLFCSLMLPWTTEIPNSLLKKYTDFIDNNYDECFSLMFAKAVRFQEVLARNHDGLLVKTNGW